MKLFRKWADGGLNPNAVKTENAVPIIIDDDLWERVRKRMDDNKNRARNKACRREYLLSGVECAACGSTYVGHTSINKSGSMTSYYLCGNRYSTKNCQSKNINANEIETFVVQHVQQYLFALDYKEVAEEIAEQFNSTSQECAKEKRELAEIQKKISNGVTAVMNGIDIPELNEEIERLRERKIDLEDIIAASSQKKTYNAQEIENSLKEFVGEYDPDNVRLSLQRFVKKYTPNRTALATSTSAYIILASASN